MKSTLSSESILVAIDVGTTKVCVLIARKIDGEHCEIIGIGKSVSMGLARGVVVDIIPAVQSIKAAIKEAELMAGVIVESAYIGISGSHISSFNSHGIAAIKRGEIRSTDISQVIAAAQAMPLPEGQQILHVIPQFFTVDSNHTVKDPLGMFGVRLEVQVHVITGAVTSVQNLMRCCEMAGVKVRDVILEPLASADAVLSSDERELGIALLDIGGGTSDFAVYQNRSIRHTKVFPIAGQLFTHDIAVCLRTTFKDAERIKKEYATACRSLMQKDRYLSIEMVQGDCKQDVRLSEVVAIVESRAEELFSLIEQDMRKNRLHQNALSGLVLTGGGSLLDGLSECAERCLGIPVRVGYTKLPLQFKETLDSPLYATSYGLLIYAGKKQNDYYSKYGGSTSISNLLIRMKSWVYDFF
jgi:cell division protein FtsA